MTAHCQQSAISLQSSAGKAESRKLKSESSKKGFTLIELLVTIAIIAILSAVGVVVYSSAQKTGRISKRAQDLKAIQTALELYKTSTGYYPDVATAGTFQCIDGMTSPNALAPNYMPIVPKDPIQSGTTNCYLYTSNNDTVAAPNPGATEYKIKTNAIPNTEMTYAEFNQQPSLIDPAHDQNTTNGCTVDALTGNVAGQSWAYYTTSATTCAYP